MRTLEMLKRELEKFGDQHDATAASHSERMLNITRDTGEFLSVLVRATRAREILEIGTSNGYSTLWLAEAVRVNRGRVVTVELAESKRQMALENFARSGLSEWIYSLRQDAGALLAQSASASVDLIFLDSDRAAYVGWWDDIKRIMKPGALLVVDNACSHAEQMAEFAALIRADGDYTQSLVPVGKGELLATKAG